MKKTFTLPLLLSTSIASAELVDVTLNLIPASSAQNTLSLSLSVMGISSSDTSQASGSINARLDIDPSTGAISSFELLSGEVTTTAVEFEARGFFNILLYSINTTDLGATVNTPAPPAPVSNGETAAELHELIINSGSLSGTSLAGDIPSQDFADNNVTGSGTVGDVVTITSALSIGSSATSQIFDLGLSFPVSITQEVEAEGLSATITADGLVRAIGQVSFTRAPTNPFLLWATDNGIANAPFEGNDFDGQLDNGLFWALGYNRGEDPRLLTPTTSGAFTLSLPRRGTASEVSLMTTTNLSNPNWVLVDTSQLSVTSNPLPPATNGIITITPDGTGPRFYRLEAEPPTP